MAFSYVNDPSAADPAPYPAEYYTQGLKEYSGQGSASDRIIENAKFNPASLGGGILSGGVGSGQTNGFRSVGTPVQKLDILEAAKRKLIKNLVSTDAFPSGYYSGLLDLVREYDSEWADFYDGVSRGHQIKKQMVAKEQKLQSSGAFAGNSYKQQAY